MSDLRLVGLSDDGSRLVLEEPDGRQSFLPVDERIHAALRGDRARLGQLQNDLESKLRPREIQARIRAGQSLEEVSPDRRGARRSRAALRGTDIARARAHSAGSSKGRRQA